MYVCIIGFKGASTSKVIGARNEIMMDDYDGQMIFGDLVGLKLPDIRLSGEEKSRKNLTQETCPNRGSSLGPLRDKSSCYHLLHSGGQVYSGPCKVVMICSLHGQMYLYNTYIWKRKLLWQQYTNFRETCSSCQYNKKTL